MRIVERTHTLGGPCFFIEEANRVFRYCYLSEEQANKTMATLQASWSETDLSSFLEDPDDCYVCTEGSPHTVSWLHEDTYKCSLSFNNLDEAVAFAKHLVRAIEVDTAEVWSASILRDVFHKGV